MHNGKDSSKDFKAKKEHNKKLQSYSEYQEHGLKTMI